MRRRETARGALLDVTQLFVWLGMDTPEVRSMMILTEVKRAPWWAQKLRPQRTALLARERVDHALRVAGHED